jgi:UPF0716 protein FxsA
MRRRSWVALLLAAAAVAEVAVLVVVVRWLGLPAAVLLMLATSTIGVLLLRREGVRAWRRFRRAVDAGEPPGVRVADGLVGLVGALLLVLPGFVGDVLGLLLLAPPVRALARRGVQRAAEGRMSSPLAGDVFGPRRVRLRRPPSGARPGPPPGQPRGPAGPDAEAVGGGVPGGGVPGGGVPGGGAVGGEAADGVIEGEIVDPDDRPGH